jgi:hypothetical protein
MVKQAGKQGFPAFSRIPLIAIKLSFELENCKARKPEGKMYRFRLKTGELEKVIGINYSTATPRVEWAIYGMARNTLFAQ